MANRKNKRKGISKQLIAALAILLALAIAAAAGWYFFFYSGDFSDLLQTFDAGGKNADGGFGEKTDSDTNSNTNTDADTEIAAGNSAEISSAEFSIHFLELGVANAGDCTLIKVGDTEILIDAGAKSSSAPTQVMCDYVASYCTDGVLEYVIATHAHEDHIAGLVGQESGSTRTGFLYQYEIGTIIQFSRHNTTSKIYQNYAAAVEYCESLGTEVYTALECVKETGGAKATYFLDDMQTISMKILYQKYYEKYASSENNYSVCVLFTQETEKTSYHYLFTGDLEKQGEQSLTEENELPHCTLFKGGHHGSSTSSNEVLLDEITPENIAICTCAGTYEYADKPTEEEPENYLNTFPTQEAIDRMSRYTQKIYVTTLGVLADDYSTKSFESMNGNIVFYFVDGALKLWCSNNTTILKDTEWFQIYRTWNGIT